MDRTHGEGSVLGRARPRGRGDYGTIWQLLFSQWSLTERRLPECEERRKQVRELKGREAVRCFPAERAGDQPGDVCTGGLALWRARP